MLHGPVKFWYAWSLRRRSMVVTLIPLLTAAIVLLVMTKVLAFNREAEDELQRGLRVLGQIHAVHAALAEAASGVRGFLLTQDEAFLAPYQRAQGLLRTSFNQLELDLKDPVQRQNLAEISALVDIKLSNLSRVQSNALREVPGSILEYSLDNKVLLDRLRSRIADMETRENQIVAAMQKDLQSARQISQWLIFTTLVAGFVLATVLAQWFARDLITRVRRIRDNAVRIGDGMPLKVYGGGYQDEVAELDRLVVRTGAVLDEKLEELRHAKASAEEANRTKTDFLSRTSHELRTPLNAIMGFTDLLKDSAWNPEQRHRLAIIGRSAHHLLQLVNDLLDLSRLENGKLALELRPVAINEAVLTARDIVAGRATAKSVTLRVDNDSGSAVATADPQRLLQILINLLDNAIKFTAADTRVTVSWQTVAGAQGKGVEITVRDDGPGVTPDLEKHLFSPFSRLDSQVEGVGLGLAISHALAQQMCGHLTYQSAPGGGSSFVLWLPLDNRAAKANLADHLSNTPTLERQPENADALAMPWVLVTENPELLVLTETVAARFRAHFIAVPSLSNWSAEPPGKPCLLITDCPPEQLQLPADLTVGRALYLTPEPPDGHDHETLSWLAPPLTARRLRRFLQELFDA